MEVRKTIELVSSMSEDDLHATKTDHAEEVLDVVLPANHQPTNMVKPSEKAFHSPMAEEHRATVLCWRWVVSAMRYDHLDAETLGQIAIRAVAVIGSVADQSSREGVEEAVSEDAFDKLPFVRPSAFDTSGERKTVIIGESGDFRPFAASGGPNCRASLLAPAEEASMNASRKLSFPDACSPSATRKMWLQFALP
jgi:hypothetical protein